MYWKVRHIGNADPRRRKSFGETCCKGETNIETVINKQSELYSDGTEKMDRHWSEKIQGPLLLPKFKIHYSNTSTQGSWSRRKCWSSLLSNYWQMLSEDSRYWSDEIKEKMSMASYWSADKWIDVLSKCGGQKKRFQCCLKPNCPETLVPWSHSRSFRKCFFWKCSYQSCIARQCTVAIGFYNVCSSRRKRKGIEINSA